MMNVWLFVVFGLVCTTTCAAVADTYIVKVTEHSMETDATFQEHARLTAERVHAVQKADSWGYQAFFVELFMSVLEIVRANALRAEAMRHSLIEAVTGVFQ
jgi:hypothetical protein